MGAQLAELYVEASALGGIEAKMALAQITRLPSTRALHAPDSAENLAMFESAMQIIRAKYHIKAGHPAKPAGQAATAGGEEMLWGVLTSLHDAMVAVFGPDGKAAFSWESPSLKARYGEGVCDQLAGYIRDQHAASISRCLVTQTGYLAEHSVKLGDISADISLSLAAVHGADGEVQGVAAFVQDITERKRQERQMKESEARLREHNRVYLELMADKGSFLGDVQSTLQRITEAAAKTIDVARASIWLLDAERTKITCVDLFERDANKHSSGIELMAGDYPSYFKALVEERTIAADDAHADPRTSCFSAGYLTPLGINSMLDVPIWVNGEMIGVVCHEHIGPQRHWTTDEVNFAYLMGNFVSMAKERVRL